MTLTEHNYYMNIAIEQALLANSNDEVPVGAIIVFKNKIIAKAHNRCEKLTDFTAHAEMQVLKLASKYLQSKYLNDCTLYVTLEPCLMCAGATFWTRLGTIVYGAKDNKRGYLSKTKNALHPKTKVIGAILEDECSKLLKDFFKEKR